MPNAGQHDDVDLGVAEEPEQVLPQQRRAALGRVEEVRAEVAVSSSIVTVAASDGQREDDQVRVDQDRPHEQRHAAPAHAGRAHVVDRRDEVDRAEDRGQAGEVDHVDPRVLAAARRVLLRRQRHVGEPAGLRRREEDRRVEREAAEQEHPVRPARSGAGRRRRARRSSAAGGSSRSRPTPARRPGRSSSSRAS